MKNPRPDIENWCAVDAMTASYNHDHQFIHETTEEAHGLIGISIYEGAPIASFQHESLALSADGRSVMDAVLAYPIPDDKEYVIDVFQPSPSIRSWAEPITAPTNIFKASSIQQAGIAEQNLATDVERIYVQTLRDRQIHSFYLTHEGEVVGWIHLVTVHPKVGHINRVYVLKHYRNRNYGSVLVQCAQAYALGLGLERLVRIPSDQEMHLYRRLGHGPRVNFSTSRLSSGRYE